MHLSMEAPQVHGGLYSSPAPPPAIQSSSPMARPRVAPYGPPLENKIHDINRRLRQRPDFADIWWWEQFAQEFFDDAATMLISFYSGASGGEKHYTLGRQMIAPYFHSIFEGGVSEMHYTFNFPREYMSHSGPTLECDSALTTTQYLQPSFARVMVESRLSFQCAFDETMRITHWTQYLIRHKEYVPREMISISLQQEGGSLESLMANFTHLGINNCTLNFLDGSAISDSVRADVKGPNMFGMAPGDCMQSWAPMANHVDHSIPTSTCMMPHSLSSQPMNDFSQSPVMSTNADSVNSAERLGLVKSPKPTKKPKRARKGSTVRDSLMSPKKPAKSCSVNNIASPLTCPPLPQQPPPQQHQDVMVVGEPILMGGELGDEDERRITRLENNVNATDFVASSQHPTISSSMLNGMVSASTGLTLDLNNTDVYDEPSITAALDALEHDSTSLQVPLP